MNADVSVLAQIDLFRDLSPQVLAAAGAWFREDRFTRDTVIFREGDPANRLWVVKSGQVKIVKYLEVGKEAVIEVVPPGELFGGAAMLMPYQPATAQALSDAGTLSLDVDDYRRILRDHPDVALRVIEMLGARLLGVIGMRIKLAERVERRIAHVLLKMASKCSAETPEGRRISVSLSRQDLADLADTTPESAIRVMSTFTRGGLVRTLPGGYIVLLDSARLAEISGEAPPA
jgi:CRP-like cAMP-binding protein